MARIRHKAANVIIKRLNRELSTRPFARGDGGYNQLGYVNRDGSCIRVATRRYLFALDARCFLEASAVLKIGVVRSRRPVSPL